MKPPGGPEVWSAPSLAARLAAARGVAPAPSRFIVWRETIQSGGARAAGYELPETPGRRQGGAAFDRWLIQHGLATEQRMSVSILVIREHLDEAGLIRNGVLERRRGGVDGPLLGNAARVEFDIPARHARRFRALPDGHLAELPAETGDEPPPSVLEPDILDPDDLDPDGFAGEDAAALAHLGMGAAILDRRAPSSFEDLLGLSLIVQARRANGAETACGIGWHGTAAFVLEADFERRAEASAAPPEMDAAVDRIVRARRLVRHETRRDERGFATIARRAGGRDLVALRWDGRDVRIEPHVLGRVAVTADQRRWMDYAGKYEARTILESWRDAEGDSIRVLTADPGLEAWLHTIDEDGVETARVTANDAAAAVLHRESASPDPARAPDFQPEDFASRDIAPEDIAPEDMAPEDMAPEETLPEDLPTEGIVPAGRVAEEAAPDVVGRPAAGSHPENAGSVGHDARAPSAPPPPRVSVDPGHLQSGFPAPADSLLTKMRAYAHVADLWRAAAEAQGPLAAGGADAPVPRAVLDRLRAVIDPLMALHARFSAGSLRKLLALAESGVLTAPAFAAALDDLAARLSDELALTRVVLLPSVQSQPEGDPPFGYDVDACFPEAAHDIEEAVLCLTLRRATAAVLHALNVMRHGLRGLERLTAAPLLAGLPADLPWAGLLAAVSGLTATAPEVVEALRHVRRVWRGRGLTPSAKYTEEEAEAILAAVEDFMRALAVALADREMPRAG